MAKGNQKINRTIAKVVVDGKIAQDLPVMFFNGRMIPLFTVIHPDKCIICGSSLKINAHYDRYIISSYGIILVPTTGISTPLNFSQFNNLIFQK
jgi:hypothetical protein